MAETTPPNLGHSLGLVSKILLKKYYFFAESSSNHNGYSNTFLLLVPSLLKCSAGCSFFELKHDDKLIKNSLQYLVVIGHFLPDFEMVNTFAAITRSHVAS